MTAPVLQLPYAYTPSWVECQSFFVPLDNAKRPEAIRANSYTGADVPVDGNWYGVDLKRTGVAADAKSVFLSGILIITNDFTTPIADLLVALRAPGSALTSDYYIGQTCEAAPGGGQRSGFAGWFPVVNGIVEICIGAVKGVAFVPPANTLPSYGLSLSVQAWVR